MFEFLKNREKVLENIVKYTVATIMLAIPLYPKFPFLKVPGTFVSIRLEDLLIFFAGILVFLTIIKSRKDFFKDGLNRAVILFLASGFISVVSATLVTQTVVPHIAFLHWIRRAEYFIPLFLGIYSVRSQKGNLDFYFKVLVIAIIVAFLYGFGQRYLSWPVIITQNQEYSKGVALRWVPGSHINSTFAGHYDLATFLVLILPTIIVSFFLLRGFLSKSLLAITLFCGLWLLVNSASRISLVSYLVASSLSLYFVKKYKEIIFIAVISIAFVGFSSNLLDRYQRLFEVGIQKVQKLKIIRNYLSVDEAIAEEEDDFFKRKDVDFTPTPTPVFEDRSTNIRLNVEWPRAIRAFSKNPLLGTGYSSITLATDNDYLRLLGEVGLLGFLCFMLIFLRVFMIFLKAYPFHKKFSLLELAFVSGTFGSLPGLFINAFFIDIFEASKFAIIFFLILGLAIGLVFQRIENEKT